MPEDEPMFGRTPKVMSKLAFNLAMNAALGLGFLAWFVAEYWFGWRHGPFLLLLSVPFMYGIHRLDAYMRDVKTAYDVSVATADLMADVAYGSREDDVRDKRSKSRTLQ
ncbi:MAG TPA: hypothetical protein PK970_11290 [Hyphomicrobiaceae bacterium]|nr:hypothetical protein [Hyphomicrobiaceae bacterium]